ncbi:SGNH/GDSL hydrolase family protein [Amycolatopsis sp. NPDC058986]|uniref:SGNH/GDSL hydrolase family protein n=1 Tax=unclassified Amycolatopsis TaxID=2618356 RepID=UPI00366DDC2E
MPLFSRARVAGAIVSSALLTTVAVPGSAVADTASAPDYVNMGDSFSAGSGILPLAPGMSPLCAQSAKNWAHVIAATKGYRLKDVSCGGASTTHYTLPQYPGVPAQVDALSSATKLVTMSIGGNDNNTFISAIIACGAAGVLSGGTGSPCETAFGDSFAHTVRAKTYPNLVKALTAVKKKAPNARVAIGDYLNILPSGAGCFPTIPLASGDLGYVRDLQTTLHDTIKRAADATDTTFVDYSEISEGHDACQPAGTRWVEPVVPSGTLGPVHPNAEGERQMAQHTLETLGLS